MLSGRGAWTLWAAQTASDALADPSNPHRPIWLTDRGIRGQGRDAAPAPESLTLPLRSGTRLIGQETDLLVYDAWSGLDPDAFGAATGALRGGGLLLLLAPPLHLWPGMPDPEAERIAVWPHDPRALSGRFLSRFARVLRTQDGVIWVSEGETPADKAPRPPNPIVPPTLGHRASDPTQPATPDQAGAIKAILRLARGRARRHLVITAHRGRGKSAALGIAAARLVLAGARRILVTAPRLSACEALLRHFALTQAGAAVTAGAQGHPPSPLRYMAPDSLRAEHPRADLLLVDEAAGIPTPLLADLLDRYPRICFATTVHGYEGTGRGFELRFRATLDQRAPGWRAMDLRAPIRWDSADPLEALVFRALLLDAEPTEIRGAPRPGSGPAELVRLDRDALGSDEPLLRQVFGLLVLAHYQTRPLDLRVLLDGPNVRVYALRQGDQILATLLAAEEGGMASPGLREAIFMGRRRPRGHLLPQTLSAHGGLHEAPALSYLRVVRIAVRPGCTRQGLGARLLRRLALDGRREGFDSLGTSFGATPELMAFWGACGYRPAQLGTSRNAASGEHAVVMLRPLSAAGWRLSTRAARRLEWRLGVLLAGPLRGLDPLVAAALVRALGAMSPRPTRGSGSEAMGSAEDRRRELASFVEGHRGLESTLPLLADLSRRRLGDALRSGSIGLEEGALLIAATRQLRPLPELIDRSGAPGREALIQRLRGLLGRLADPCACDHPRAPAPTGAAARPASAAPETPEAGAIPHRSSR